MIQVEQYRGNFSDKLEIIYYLTDKCNYTCEYCYWYSNTPKNISFNKQIKIITNLFKLKNKSNLFLFGGEPTTYNKLYDLLLFIDNNKPDNFTVELQTNGSPSLKYFKNISKFDISLSLSYHHNQIQQSRIRNFFENCDYLNSIDKLKRLDFMCSYDNYKEQIEILNILKLKSYNDKILLNYGYMDLNNNGHRSTVKELYEDVIDNFNYIEEYEVNGKMINTSDLFHSDYTFKGMNCNAGNQMMIVDNNGEFAACTSEWLCEKNKFNILDNFNIFKLRSRMVVTCKFNKCNGDFWVSKW